MRIAVIAPPYYEVPPVAYGGTELVCYTLVEGLVDRGHDVTLVAAGPARTRARHLATFTDPPPEGEDDVAVEVVHAAAVGDALAGAQFDVVHDHTRVAPLTAVTRTVPTVVTVHGAVHPASLAHAWAAAVGSSPLTHLVAISGAQRRCSPALPWHATVHNGIPVEQYRFQAQKDDFALYLGRFHPAKGVHLAIDAAEAAGVPIVLAGTWTIPSERDYFEGQIRPRLGPCVEWVGPVGGVAKGDLLGRARCLLFPACWDEPFGLAIVEALACGTPVVGLNAGAVAELVRDGATGIVCRTQAELGGAIATAGSIDPGACREDAVRRFGAARMAEEYERVYEEVAGCRESH